MTIAAPFRPFFAAARLPAAGLLLALALSPDAALSGAGWILALIALFLPPQAVAPPRAESSSALLRRIGGVGLAAAAAIFSPWGEALALCLIAGLLFSETLLIGDAKAAAVQRLLLLALTAIALFFGVLPQIVADPRAATAAAYARDIALGLSAAIAAAAAAQSLLQKKPTNNGGATARDGTAARDDETAHGGDFFFALLFALLLAVLALAATTLSAGVSYYRALALATTGALALAAAAMLLWLPLGGGGLSVIFARHVVALSIPLEEWTGRLAALARARPRADDLLAAAMAELARLPQVAGIEWRVDDSPPQTVADAKARFYAQIRYAPISARIFSRRLLSPAQRLNFYLLVRIAAEYYLSKRREEQYARENFSRAVHETGARITHDIKNTVHALSGLAALAGDGGDKAAGIIRRQLPELARRLAAATEKLKAPQIEQAAADSPALAWWRRAQLRWEGKTITFQTAADPAVDSTVDSSVDSDADSAADSAVDSAASSLPFAEGNSKGGAPIAASAADLAADSATVPTALFDRALDNLLENALAKPGRPRITATLFFINNRPALRVTDDGAAIAPARAARIMQTPVDSDAGLGIALYHLAQEAAQNNYRLTLAANRDGEVAFALAPAGGGCKN